MWPRLIAVGALGAVVGLLTLGQAPWGGLVMAVVSLAALAAVGVTSVATGTGIPGLCAAYLGLLAGMAATTWFRISGAESGWGMFRSIEPVSHWRLAYLASVGGGLFAVAVGYVVAGRLSARREPHRPWLALFGALAGSVTAAAALAVLLGTTALVIPEGAVVLHVTVTDGSITLEPTSVPAGEVYFIRSQRGQPYDGPFMESGTGPQGVSGAIFHGPLSDADVAGLEEGRLPDGSSVAELYGTIEPGPLPPWPAPDEFGGHERLDPGRYAWWTLEVTEPGGPRMRDLVFFEAY